MHSGPVTVMHMTPNLAPETPAFTFILHAFIFFNIPDEHKKGTNS